jgi:hypothetical protein
VPHADHTWERRQAPIAGAAALLSVAVTIAAVPVAATDAAPRVGDPSDLDLLTGIGYSGSGQVAALLLRIVGLALLVPLALFLFRAVRARAGELSPAVSLLGVAAFAVVGVSTAIGFFEVRDVARHFVATGPQTMARAEAELSDARGGGLLRVANVMQVAGGLLFGLWVALTARATMQVGLQSRFLGIFGIGAGVVTAIGLPVGSSLFLGWVGSVGVLACGYWPGGRPAAWEAA